MAWAAGCSAHIRPIKCVCSLKAVGPARSVREVTQGHGTGCNMSSQLIMHDSVNLPTLFLPAVLSEGERPALFVHLKANFGGSWFSVGARPRFYMTALHRGGQMFPSNAPATAKLKGIIKQQSLHGNFVQKPYDIYRVLKKIELSNFMISCPRRPQTSYHVLFWKHEYFWKELENKCITFSSPYTQNKAWGNLMFLESACGFEIRIQGKKPFNSEQNLFAALV